MTNWFEFEFRAVGNLEIARWRGGAHLPGWTRMDLWGDAPPFIDAYGMTGATGILYPTMLALAWRLGTGMNRFALPEYDGVHNCVRAGHDYELVDWDYEIEVEAADWVKRDRGFVRAESLFARPGSTQSWDRGLGAALAEVSTWQELISLVPFGDVSNTTCLFWLEDTRRTRLAQQLRGNTRPDLSRILRAPRDLFAVITNAEDDPDRDSLLIAGNAGLNDRLTEEATALTLRVDQYLQATQAAENQAQWLVAINALAALE